MELERNKKSGRNKVLNLFEENRDLHNHASLP